MIVSDESTQRGTKSFRQNASAIEIRLKWHRDQVVRSAACRWIALALHDFYLTHFMNFYTTEAPYLTTA